MTVWVSILLQGKAKGNREYSSIIVKKYLFLLADGKGPLNSILNRSIGWVAFIKCVSTGLRNLGFTSVQTLQEEIILRTSSSV